MPFPNYSRVLPETPSTTSTVATLSRVHSATTAAAVAAGKRCRELWREKNKIEGDTGQGILFTVWKRSSMSFQGTDGFTVFDRRGSLAFRVDNYTRKSSLCVSGGVSGGLVLMDGSGKPLLTLKPQLLSMQHQWNGYKGADEYGKSSKTKVFSMRRPSFLIHTSGCEAEVFMETAAMPAPADISQAPPPTALADFRIEGSFRRRNCKIKNQSGKLAAKIVRKRTANTTILLSDDVFSLEVQPGFEVELIMAFVIILDRICAKPFAPVLCS